eukprot:Gb_31297 [translate_table: standard]
MATLGGRQDAVDFELLQGALAEQDASSISEGRVDQLVYKLVRVEGDGTLVAATEDEVLEVEHLLEDDRGHKSSKGHRRHMGSENMAKKLASEDFHGSDHGEDQDVTGLLEPEDAEAEKRKLNAKLEFLEVMLQRVKEEERLRIASVIPGHSSSYILNKAARNQSRHGYGQQSPDPVLKLQSADAPFQESISPVNSGSSEEHAMQDANLTSPDSRKKIKAGKDSDGSPPPQAAVMLNSDLSPVKGEMCLDNLSIRELHEAFRRTFGRETSVKDKQWLKRRISMGFSNTREVTNSNVVLENKTSGIKKQERDYSLGTRHTTDQSVQPSANAQSVRGKAPAGGAFESVAGKRLHGRNLTGTSIVISQKEEYGLNDEVSGEGMRAGKRLRKPKAEYAEYDEVLGAEEIAGKRVRKPTRRYIEELSEVESRVYNGRTVPAVRDSGHGHSPLKSRIRPPHWNGVEGMALVTRQDSLGGSGIQVPFVSRVRRGRPRKNCTSLMKYNSSGMAAKLVKKALCVRAARYDGDGTDMKWRSKVPSESIQQTVDENSQNEENMLLPITTEGPCISEPEPEPEFEPEPLDYDLEGDASDDYVATVPTAKGGTRRKHHRAWTLGEVMKLVEGVSRCGAGRWSEIKKVAFSSYGHRTSVDLKDKWRNLLRASYAQLQANKEGRNQRKHASVPIPTPILVRVRELAAMQSQALCGPNSSSVSRSGRTVHKKQHV